MFKRAFLPPPASHRPGAGECPQERAQSTGGIVAGKIWEFFGYRSDDHSPAAVAAATDKQCPYLSEVCETLRAKILFTEGAHKHKLSRPKFERRRDSREFRRPITLGCLRWQGLTGFDTRLLWPLTSGLSRALTGR